MKIQNQEQKQGRIRRWIHKLRRTLLGMTLVGLCLICVGAAILTMVNILVKRTTQGRILTQEAFSSGNHEVMRRLQELDADCILVLGAGVRDDGSPSLMLSDRLETGTALYDQGVCDRILMTGDHGRKEYDEVNVMKSIAVEAGIPSSHVFMDHAGFNTYDSLYRAKHIFQAQRVIIVTQEYHLYRALYIARALGLEAIGVAAPGENYYGQTYREVREMAARTKDFVMTWFKPEASIMGEAIPVSGDGNVTNDK